MGEGIYAFDFTPDERALLYKTGCTRGGEACDLMSIPTDTPPTVVSDGGPGKNPAARKLVSAVDGYDFSPDGKWLWLTFKSALGNTADLAVLPATPEPGLPRYVDFKVEPSPRWTGDGHLAYLVNLPKRAGLYLADPNKAQRCCCIRRCPTAARRGGHRQAARQQTEPIRRAEVAAPADRQHELVNVLMSERTSPVEELCCAAHRDRRPGSRSR